MMVYKVKTCGIGSPEIPVLKEEEINELIFRLQNGDSECKEEFIKVNTRLILSVTQCFNNRGKNAEDLFHVGSIGLMNSINNFNLSIHGKFSTYAVPVIVGEIRSYLRETNPMRINNWMKDIAYKTLQVRDRLVGQDNKEPTLYQIAKELQLPIEDIVFALDRLLDPVSLLEPINNDIVDPTYVMDRISNIKNLDDSPLQNASIKKAMKNLNYKEKLILNLRFFHGKSQMEVAEEIGISKEQIARLEKTALKNMRKHV